MTITTFKKLEQERVKWKPQPLLSLPFDLEESSGIEGFVSRAIALGLMLELPVGQWVNEARKLLKNSATVIQEDAMAILASNIKDETVHYKAFEYAEKAYPLSDKDISESASIFEAWDSHSENPLMLAALAETAIFLPSLAILRLYGGDSMSTLANDVSRDEYRHVATNRAILNIINYPLHTVSSTAKKLQEDTLAWLVGDFNYADLGIDFDWLSEQADSLLYTGKAEELEELTINAEYRPPFEHTNKYSY